MTGERMLRFNVDTGHNTVFMVAHAGEVMSTPQDRNLSS